MGESNRQAPGVMQRYARFYREQVSRHPLSTYLWGCIVVVARASYRKEAHVLKHPPDLSFILTRLLVPGLAQAMLMLDRGDGSVEDIDRSMELGAGHPMGPLTLAVRGHLDANTWSTPQSSFAVSSCGHDVFTFTAYCP